jgi:hypothetical protein
MPYRANLEAQQARCDVLERELAELHDRANTLAHVQRELVDKEREVLMAKELLTGMGSKRTLLDSLRVASPCNASWDDMVGDERVRFCGQCSKNVYNLSAMSRDEAEAVVRAKEGDLCARMLRRIDGTVVTTDCPVGLRKRRARHAGCRGRRWSASGGRGEWCSHALLGDSGRHRRVIEMERAGAP